MTRRTCQPSSLKVAPAKTWTQRARKVTASLPCQGLVGLCLASHGGVFTLPKRSRFVSFHHAFNRNVSGSKRSRSFNFEQSLSNSENLPMWSDIGPTNIGLVTACPAENQMEPNPRVWNRRVEHAPHMVEVSLRNSKTQPPNWKTQPPCQLSETLHRHPLT